MSVSRTTICTLPDELILEIVRHFSAIRSYEPQSTAFKEKGKEKARQYENHVRQVALYSLCLTAHRLRRIATPVLYASFMGCATWHGYEPLKLFHRSISSSEKAFGMKVHLAEFLEYVENRLCDYLGNSLYDDTEFYGAVNMVARYFYLLSDIVKHAPNLRHLSIVSLETDEVSFWTYIIPEDIDTWAPRPVAKVVNHGFSRLHTLCIQIHTEGYTYGRDPAWFRRICSAMTSVPSLADFRVSGITTSGQSLPMLGNFKKLRRLEITECGLDFDEIIDTWSACEDLQHIVCEWAFLNCAAEVPSDLHSELSRHSKTLETFVLDTREVRFSHLFATHPQLLGSLQPFTVLKSLVICETALLGDTFPLLDFPDQQLQCRIASLLPTSLERLTLLLHSDYAYEQDCRLDEAFALWHLAEDGKRDLPNLQEINVRYPMTLSAPNLAKAFQEASVRFNIVKEPKSGYFG